MKGPAGFGPGRAVQAPAGFAGKEVWMVFGRDGRVVRVFIVSYL